MSTTANVRVKLRIAPWRTEDSVPLLALEPAPPELMAALQSVNISESDSGPTSFELVFRAGRGGMDKTDDPVVTAPSLQNWSRVQVWVALGDAWQMLVDGVITRQQFTPSAKPGGSSYTLHGDDLSVLLGRHQLSASLPGMSPAVRAAMFLTPLLAFGVVPLIGEILPARMSLPVDPTKNVVASGTASEELGKLASAISGEWFISPSPVAGYSIAYLGPRLLSVLTTGRLPTPIGGAGLAPSIIEAWAQSFVLPPLMWNSFGSSNLTAIDFSHDATGPTTVVGAGLHPMLGEVTFAVPVSTNVPLSRRPTMELGNPFVGLRQNNTGVSPGNLAETAVDAALEVNERARATVTATGELDMGRYGRVLRARGLVEVRGVGMSYDGYWSVQSVTHSFRRGEYKQAFSLARDGLGALRVQALERFAASVLGGAA